MCGDRGWGGRMSVLSYLRDGWAGTGRLNRAVLCDHRYCICMGVIKYILMVSGRLILWS